MTTTNTRAVDAAVERLMKIAQTCGDLTDLETALRAELTSPQDVAAVGDARYLALCDAVFAASNKSCFGAWLVGLAGRVLTQCTQAERSAWQDGVTLRQCAAGRAQEVVRAEPVAEIVSSGENNFPILQWLSADHSFCAPIGSKFYTAPPSTAPAQSQDDLTIDKSSGMQSLRDYLRSVERIAFEIPPPNPYTPQLVQASIQARRVINAFLAAQPKDTAPVPVAPSQITLDFKQTTELLNMFGGEPSTVTLAPGDGHSGKGLYAYWAEVPEEGAIYLGVTDDEAAPAAELGDAKDAERYQLLRRGQQWSVIDGIGDILRAERLDASIDAILASKPTAGEVKS